MIEILRDPRVLFFVESTVLAIVLLVMALEGAPAWALVLALYVGLRASWLTLSADRGALQDSIRSVNENVDRVHNLIENVTRKR